jgi:hypothetical protein
MHTEIPLSLSLTIALELQTRDQNVAENVFSVEAIRYRMCIRIADTRSKGGGPHARTPICQDLNPKP